MDLSQRLAKLTPEQRAKLQARLGGRPESSSTIPTGIEKRSSAQPTLLSFAQERLWFLEQLEGASATYNICVAVRLRGTLAVEQLERALKEIVQRHESLRTTFPLTADDQPPVQRIVEALDFHLEVIDLPPASAGEDSPQVKQKVDELASRPMSLARGPLFHAYLLRLSAMDHVLTLVVHHMIADGWSFDIFFRELSTLYADFRTGQPASLPPLKVQYADFAQWQREQLQGPELKRVLDYWQKRLAGIPPLLELPTDFSRQAEQSYRGDVCERWLSPALTHKIHQLARETESTLFMMLLAGFKTLLYRYSGQADILVGSPVTSRNRVELEPLIGFFVNMLPLRTDFSGNPTVRELIQQVRDTTLEALSHQELPFERLIRELRPARALSHAPLFQVTLMFQQENQQGLHLPGMTSEPIPASTATAKFDLSLFASDSKAGLHLWLEYSTDLFAGETAKRMLTHLECLLESMVANPNAQITQLSMIPEAERAQILVEWNQTVTKYPEEKTIHGLFEDQVATTPTAIAVEYEGQRITYRDLAHRAAILAGELIQKGVTTETHVGIYVERSIDMVVGVLGILKAGGTYVPLDPAFPKDRLAFMIADARCPVIVTQTRFADQLPENQAQIVYVDKSHAAKSASPIIPSSQAGPANLAYILFTSGSTGRPKGVQIPHRAVVNFLHSMRHAPGLVATDTLLAVTTLSFDIAGLELFLPLTTGAKVVIAARDDAMDPARLAKLLKNSDTTLMQATPATWRMLLDAGWTGDRRLKILCGGEAIDRDLADRLLHCCGELWNMYGPTETTIWSTTERLLPNEPITIGRPISNTQLYILDPSLEPTPAGVIGELFIGGDGVARGYLDRPELTAEKFLTNPFDKTGKGRMYRTGDLARYRSDRRVEFLGRADHQVKIRGFRIEIGEIETALAAIDGLAQAVVTVREDTPGEKRLIAYLVLDSKNAGSDQQSANIRDFAVLRTTLREKLPDYMIPSAFVILEAFPLTPNGKVDRKALPPPDKSFSPEATYEPPRNPIEEKLAGIMATLLKLPKVGRSDDFFALGGYSILAVSLFNEVERVFGQRLPLATLFRAPTVAAIAAVLASESFATKEWDSLVPIQSGNDQKPKFFCVHGAGGNILLYRDLVSYLGPDYPFYGLQSQGLDKKSEPLTTVEEMADKYCREIRSVQQKGPYCLGGYCLGGTIAYEMAQRLRRDGDEVALLAMFDTYNSIGADDTRPLHYLWQKIVFHTRNLASLSLKDLPGYLSSKARVASDGELRALWKGLIKSRQKDHQQNAPHPAEINIQEINDAASASYRPKEYAGRVTVFKPKVNYDFLPDPKMGWGELVTGELNIEELPINPHAMLVAPFVQDLAVVLRKKIDSVAGQPNG